MKRFQTDTVFSGWGETYYKSDYSRDFKLVKTETSSDSLLIINYNSWSKKMVLGKYRENKQHRSSEIYLKFQEIFVWRFWKMKVLSWTSWNSKGHFSLNWHYKQWCEPLGFCLNVLKKEHIILDYFYFERALQFYQVVLVVLRCYVISRMILGLLKVMTTTRYAISEIINLNPNGDNW